MGHLKNSIKAKESLWAIVAAGGMGERFGGGTPKQFLQLAGVPVLQYCLDCFLKSKFVQGLVLVLPKDHVRDYEKWASSKVKIALGGKSRQQSVLNGLALVPEDISWILIHDAARPFIDDEIISSTFECAKKTGAAVASIPVTDTLKLADSGETVKKTVSREGLFKSQTPQVFKRSLLKSSFKLAKEKNWEATDEATLMEQMGVTVGLARGSSLNFKITTEEDFELARCVLLGQKKQ